MAGLAPLPGDPPTLHSHPQGNERRQEDSGDLTEALFLQKKWRQYRPGQPSHTNLLGQFQEKASSSFARNSITSHRECVLPTPDCGVGSRPQLRLATPPATR